MKQAVKPQDSLRSDQINRAGYLLFIGLVIYQAIKGDYDWAIANLGIALVFDPFSSTSWNNRSLSQKLVLFVHLLLTFGGLAFLIFKD